MFKVKHQTIVSRMQC